MPVTWVRMRHFKTGGEAHFPNKSASIDRAKRRGFRLVKDNDDKKPRRGQAAGSQSSEQREEN